MYKTHEEFVQLGEELKFEKNVETYKRLKQEQKTRFNSRELAVGTIKFIAELFNVSFLKSRVMELCMKNLLRSNETTELDVECFCVLLSSIGAKLEVSPKGSEVIEEYLTVLEQIVDNYAESFVLRIRCMILDVFELRANNWQPMRADQVPLSVAPENKVKDASELIEAAKETRGFLKGLAEVLRNLDREKMFEFMYSFMDLKFAEDRLEGAVKLIFEQTISSSEVSMFALICKGLADLKAVEADGEGDRETTNCKGYLMRLLRHEIDVIRSNVAGFRGILQRIEKLKHELNRKQSEKMKSALEIDFKLSSRVVAVSNFIAELFNADFIESRFIFDEVFILLVNPKVVSDASIECFCKLVKVAGTKMVTEKNRDILMKETTQRLIEAARTIEIFPKTKFFIKDVVSFIRFQLKLSLNDDLKSEIESYPRQEHPWNTSWSEDASAGEKHTKRKQHVNQSDDIKYEAVRQFVPQGMPPLEYISKIPPQNVS